MKQSSLLKRLLLFFLVLLLPVIIIAAAFQWYGVHSVRLHVTQSVSERIDDLLKNADNKFTETNTLASSLLTSSRVVRVANPQDPMSSYDRTVQVNFIRDTLSNIRLSNPSVSNVRLHLPLLHITYNPDNAYDYPTKTAIGSSTVLTDEDYDSLIAMRSESGKLHLHQENLVFLQYSSWNDPHIIVETVYAIPDLEQMLQNTLLYPGSFYLFIPEGTPVVLTNSTDDTLADRIASSNEQTSIRIGKSEYYLFRYYLKSAGASYVQLIPSSELIPGLQFSIQYCICYTAAILICALLSVYSVFRIIKNPIDQMTDALKKLADRSFDSKVEGPVLTEFQQLYDTFNQMTEQLDDLIEKEFQQRLLLEKAQLKQLQAQINPHFLYNSFFSLNQMISRNMNEPAKELSRELGTYFKFITRDGRDVISLSEEYEHALVYANIQAMRFDGRITIDIAPLPDEVKEQKVPRLILQPLLENAFQHGLRDKIRDGLLSMQFHIDQGSTLVIIEDNGDNLPDSRLASLKEQLDALYRNSPQPETTGLLNIARRLQLYFSRDDALQLSRSPLGGLKITLKF